MANNEGNEQKSKGTSIRLVILIGILLVVALAAGYEFLIARGPYQRALKALEEINSRAAVTSADNQRGKQQDDVLVHEAIGREPFEREEKENAYILETYRFGRKITLNGYYTVYVKYLVRPKRGVTLHSFDTKPFDRDKLPQGPVDLPGFGDDADDVAGGSGPHVDDSSGDPSPEGASSAEDSSSKDK